MGNGILELAFFDSWAWLIFIAIGLVMVLLELFVGIDTGLDLVFLGSAFILGGLISIPLDSWVWTAIITAIVGVIYIAVGRRYIHRRMAVPMEKTNIDTIVGKRGVVEKAIKRNIYGLVKIGMEQWRAGADEEIPEGEEITVTGISGATLQVKKTEGGSE